MFRHLWVAGFTYKYIFFFIVTLNKVLKAILYCCHYLPLVSLTPVAILPKVSLMHVANINIGHMPLLSTTLGVPALLVSLLWLTTRDTAVVNITSFPSVSNVILIPVSKTPVVNANLRKDVTTGVVDTGGSPSLAIIKNK